MHYNPQRHHRGSIRLKGYDYSSAGAYFVTVCVRNRKHALGSVRNGRVDLSPNGLIVLQAWQYLPQRFPRVTLDAFVVMPDHIHGIIILSGDPPSDNRRDHTRARGTQPGSLPAIMQRLKSLSTQLINKANNTPGQRFWQEDYYEHIVRSDDEMERIRRYIVTNPTRWQD
jgi:REP element-mobilizing transposase RayT